MFLFDYVVVWLFPCVFVLMSVCCVVVLLCFCVA